MRLTAILVLGQQKLQRDFRDFEQRGWSLNIADGNGLQRFVDYVAVSSQTGQFSPMTCEAG